MAEHAVNTDRFQLLVDGQEVPIASSYTVNAGVFEVPANFDMVIGHTGLLTDLIQGYAEFTPFELSVNDIRVMQGDITDLTGVGGNATRLKVAGSDRLWRLTATKCDSDQTFTEVTFADLVEYALKQVGLEDVSVVSSALANRKAITGKTKIKETVDPSQESTETEIAKTVEQRTKTVLNSLAIETGTTWWDFLVTQFQRGGLFLWADSFGGFVLGQPNGKQDPLYRLFRQRGGSGESGNVTILGQPDFSRGVKARYTEFQVMGRKGSGKGGRGSAFSRQIDQEMVALLNPLEADRADGGKRKKVETYHDDKVKTPAQAAFLALRKMAESRRNSFSLSYTVSGHTVDAISGGGRLVWQPDTTVHVVDDELGIDGPMYISNCQFSRDIQGKTITKLALGRCEDLLFGEEDLLAPPRTVAKKGIVRRVVKEEFKAVFWQKDPTWGNLPTERTIREKSTLVLKPRK